MERLKPCPFCGGEVTYTGCSNLGNGRDSYYYFCRGCGSSFGIPLKRDYKLIDEEKEVAKELFNERKERRTMKAKLNVECTMWDLETVREDSPSILGIWTRDGVFGDDEVKDLTGKEFLRELLGNKADDSMTVVDMENKLGEDYYWLPIFGYSHGGYTFSVTPFSDSWDSGRAGIIVIRKDVALSELGIRNKAEADDFLKEEVEVFDNLQKCFRGYEWYASIDGGYAICNEKIYWAKNYRDAVAEMREDCPKGIAKLFNNIPNEDLSGTGIHIVKNVKLIKR